MSIFWKLRWYLKKEWKSYVFGVFALLIVSVFQIMPPKIIEKIVDLILKDELTPKILLTYMLFLVGIGFILYVLRYIWRLLIYGSSIRLGKLLRHRMYNHYLKMDSAFFRKRRTGDLMAHATNDIQAVQNTAGDGILTLVDALSLGLFVIGAMAFTISWKLTIVCLIPLPFMVILTNKYGKLLHNYFYHAQVAFSSLNNKVQESLSGIRVIKAYHLEEYDKEQFEKESIDNYEKNLKVNKIDALFDPTISIVIGSSYILAIIYGSHLVSMGEITIGKLVSFTIYLGLLVWPMLAFGLLFNIVERGKASYERISTILDVENSIYEMLDKKSLDDWNELSININDFSYENEIPILQDISLQVKKGETIGIVGKTGSGKTTLLKTLLRECDITRGEISFDNENIKNVSIHDLRSKISYVPQEHILFSGTVKDNIAFCNPGLDIDLIKEAAKFASVDKDIEGFTDGYETIIGEKGISLSGGQKQRISIARSLMSAPEILLLDDCLSAVDSKTEERILATFKDIRKDKTTFIVAHRISAVMHADCIYVIDQGRVTEKGTHEQLLRYEGWYQEMFEKQKLESLVTGEGE